MIRLFFTILAILVLIPLWPSLAGAGAFELSTGFSYNRSNYSQGSYTVQRRIGGSIGYHFNELSGIEFSYQDATNITHLINWEDTVYHDRIFSLDWVQNLMGRNSPFQPYFKVGVGQLNRKATGSYAWGGSPPEVVNQVTGVLSAGLKLYLTQTFAIRSEVTSYLSGGKIGSWKDNIAITLGASMFF